MILCADDFGLAPDINEAILNLAKDGRIQAVSCMMSVPEFRNHDFDALLKLRSSIDLGIHLVFNDHRPLSPVANLHRLVSADENFYPYGHLFRMSYRGQIQPDWAELEIRAQLLAFKDKTGKWPDFIDGHYHVQQLPGIREGLFSVLDARPEPELQPYVRNSYIPVHQIIKRQVSGWKNFFISFPARHFRKELLRRGVPTNDGFAGIYDYSQSAKYPDYLKRFSDDLAKFPNSIVMVHPGFKEPWRKMEYETLQTPPFSSNAVNRFIRTASRSEIANTQPQA